MNNQIKKDILNIALTNRNEEKSIQMQNYMRNKFKFLGIQTPLRKSIIKPYLKKFKQLTYDEQISLVTDIFLKGQYRELQYIALDLYEIKSDLKEEDIKTIEILATNHSWWDSVDSLHNILGKYFKKFPEKRTIITEEWISSQNIWLIRLLIDHQLNFKDKTDWDYLKDISLRVCHIDEFFIQSAIGWSLSNYSKFHPDLVLEFVNNNNLGKFASKRSLEWILKNKK